MADAVARAQRNRPETDGRLLDRAFVASHRGRKSPDTER